MLETQSASILLSLGFLLLCYAAALKWYKRENNWWLLVSCSAGFYCFCNTLFIIAKFAAK